MSIPQPQGGKPTPASGPTARTEDSNPGKPARTTDSTGTDGGKPTPADEPTESD